MKKEKLGIHLDLDGIKVIKYVAKAIGLITLGRCHGDNDAHDVMMKTRPGYALY